MDIVASSQPWQDGEDELSGIDSSTWTSHTGDADSDFDFVCSSQPFEDGVDCLDYESRMKVRLQWSVHWLFTNTIQFLAPYTTAHDSKLAADVRVSYRDAGQCIRPSSPC